MSWTEYEFTPQKGFSRDTGRIFAIRRDLQLVHPGFLHMTSCYFRTKELPQFSGLGRFLGILEVNWRLQNGNKTRLFEMDEDCGTGILDEVCHALLIGLRETSRFTLSTFMKAVGVLHSNTSNNSEQHLLIPRPLRCLSQLEGLLHVMYTGNFDLSL